MLNIIKMEPGDEIVVNGFIIRAVGSGGEATGLQVYHQPGTGRWSLLYAGVGSDIVLHDTICVGKAEELANSDGWPKAVEKAKAALANDVRYRSCR